MQRCHQIMTKSIRRHRIRHFFQATSQSGRRHQMKMSRRPSKTVVSKTIQMMRTEIVKRRQRKCNQLQRKRAISTRSFIDRGIKFKGKLHSKLTYCNCIRKHIYTQKSMQNSIRLAQRKFARKSDWLILNLSKRNVMTKDKDPNFVRVQLLMFTFIKFWTFTFALVNSFQYLLMQEPIKRAKLCFPLK